MSSTSGISNLPSPPSSRGVLINERCVYLESTETASTSQSRSLKSCARSENAMISVGQTKVKSEEKKRRVRF